MSGVYRENLQNTFINSTDPFCGASTTSNGGKSRYDGEELQLIEHAGKIGRLRGDWSGFFNSAHNNATFFHSFTDATTGNAVNAGQPLANVPQNLVSAGINWSWNGWLAGATAQYVSSEYLQQGFAGTPTSLRSPPYFLVDIVVQKTIPVHVGYIHAFRVSLNLDSVFSGATT